MNNRNIEKRASSILIENSLMKIPINTELLTGALGISLEYQDLEDEVSGFLVRKDHKNIIGVNKNHHKVRQRFTISHEIGHHILHMNQQLFVDYNERSILYRSNTKTQNYKMEKEANQFAASLLMPKNLIEIEISKLSDYLDYEDKIYELSQLFQVSKQAMDYRLKSLGFYDYGF